MTQRAFGLLFLAAFGSGALTARAADSFLPRPPSQEGPPAEFHRLCPEAQQAWTKAKRKTFLPDGFARVIQKCSAQVRFIEGADRIPEEMAIHAEWEARDHAEFVKPAPKGFKPGDSGKIKLMLFPKKTMLRKGETFWYRMELQNVGREPILLRESPSIWKIGNALAMKYEFRVTPPGEKEREVIPLYDEVHRPRWWNFEEYPAHIVTEKEKRKYFDAWEDKRLAEDARWSNLRVILQPGEILVSRAWQLGDRYERLDLLLHMKNANLPIKGKFRELALENLEFDKVGTYRIKLVYNDSPPSPPSEEEIQESIKAGIGRDYEMKFYKERVAASLGVVESNTVAVEVHP